MILKEKFKNKFKKKLARIISNREVDKENNNMHFLYGVIIIKL